MTRQQRILAAIADHWTEHGYAPSIRWIAEELGAGSPSTVLRDLRALRAAGKVTFRDRQPRTLRLVKQTETTRT